MLPHETVAAKELQGWLYLRPFLPNSTEVQAFAEQVVKHTKSSFNITIDTKSVDLTYSVALFDAIMLYAHAATKVLSDGGDLRDGKAVTAAVRKTSFVGAAGRTVSLDSKGDRVES